MKISPLKYKNIYILMVILTNSKQPGGLIEHLIFNHMNASSRCPSLAILFIVVSDGTFRPLRTHKPRLIHMWSYLCEHHLIWWFSMCEEKSTFSPFLFSCIVILPKNKKKTAQCCAMLDICVSLGLCDWSLRICVDEWIK